MIKNASQTVFDVAGIGNAIVDVLSFTDDEFLVRQGMAKGTMTLVDELRAESIYTQMGQTAECSGGSAANTLAALASLGSKTAFIGKVKSDQIGTIFIHDLHAVGVHFSTPPSESGDATASCLVCVTPDAQRTMATYLGACRNVSEEDIDEDVLAHSSIVYIEGYLWDSDNAKAAIRKAIDIARRHKRKIAFTLSDTFCVARHREEFRELLQGDIDILFANEPEIKSLFDTQDFDDAMNQVQGSCEIVTVTRSERGSVVATQEAIVQVPTQPVARVVDTTGAGDLYAAGFLYGFAKGMSLAQCAALGNRCAGEIIMQLGARSMRPLSSLLKG